MFNRRTFIAATLAASLATTPALAQNTPVSIAIGLFVAQAEGYYAEAGLDVTILPYSDTAAGTLVANGIADFGIMGSVSLYTQRTAGADLVATFAVTQTETGRVVFNADRTDIQRPADLDGLVYGGFGSDWETALIGTIIRHDGGEGVFETVTLGTSAYQALANGAVDFTLEVYTWEGVKAELEGQAQRAFRYADFGVPDEHTTLIGASRAYLDANAETAAAFIAATKRGYAFAVDHPELAADIIIAANSDILTDRALIVASMNALVDGHYLRTSGGALGTFDPAKMEAIGAFMLETGMLKDGDGNTLTVAPDFSAYYTNDLAM